MTDLTGFVRGLAESVLNRAKSIRTTLTAYGEEPVARSAAKATAKKRGATKKTTTKRAPARRSKRSDA